MDRNLLGLILSMMTVDSQIILSGDGLVDNCPVTSTEKLEHLINSAARKVITSHLNMMESQMSKHKMELDNFKKEITKEMKNIQPTVPRKAEHLGVRLINGSSSVEGRVEIYKDGVWGNVCDDGWDSKDANVICKQLFGYDRQGLAVSNAVFGKGTGAIHLDIRCDGTETDVLDCPHSTTANCSYSKDAGVVCFLPNRHVRLSNGNTTNEGIIEVFINGRWGAVCDQMWDDDDAKVACRSLGYTGGIPATSSVFGSGNGHIWFDDIKCNGNEGSLLECADSVVGSSRCISGNIAGVVCYPTRNDSVRIINGSSVDEGRVEVFINGQWGSVCDSAWGKTDADVTCKSLGYRGGIPVSSSVFGEGSGKVWLNKVNCYGNKKSLLECSQSMIGSSSCGHGNTAGVVCYHTRNDSVRVVNGSTAYEGRVEILINGKWRSICDRGWGRSDAKVTCKSLGYSRGIPAVSSMFGESSAQIWWFSGIICGGYENSLLGCLKSVIGSNMCTSGSNAGVVCYQTGNDLVRIVNGSSEYEGRVEVLINEQWQRICDNGWDKNDADVTCKSIGYSGGLPVSSPVFGEGPETKWMLSANCLGIEPSLLGCIQSVIGSNSCSNGGHAGVVCYHTGNDSVRIVNGSSVDEGRVEVLINGEWQNVCDRGWDKDAADVTCRSLGYSGGLPVSSSLFGETNGEIWLNGMDCNGNEDSLLKCRQSKVEFGSCGGGGSAGVVCYHAENELVRMVDGASAHEGRVEILINGQWRRVCIYLWDTNDANVTCRGLGYSGGIPTLSSLSSVFGENKGQLGLSNINCAGNENSVIECIRSVRGSNVCNNGRNAGAVCYHTANEIMRIVNENENSTTNDSVVNPEVLVKGFWIGFCKDRWADMEATVVCRSLGYPGYGSLVQRRRDGNSFGVLFFKDFKCTGWERTLAECKFGSIGLGDCSMTGAIELECNIDAKRIIRLVNGATSNKGRVEVFINGRWGTVCDYYWDDTDARVVCRSLGYSGNSIAHTNAYFGRGSGSIWLEDVECQGTESSIFDCKHRGYGKHYCGHGQDAGATCQ